MAQLVYKSGRRRHLFAVRHLLPDPNDQDCYVAGQLVSVYSSTGSMDVIRQVSRGSLVFPPYAVVHVTGYMLALARQGQAGFRVWSLGLIGWFAQAGVSAKRGDFTHTRGGLRVLTPTVYCFPRAT